MGANNSNPDKWKHAEPRGAIITGNDGAGKSMLLLAAKYGEIIPTNPDNGYLDETLDLSRRRKLKCWAVGATGGDGHTLYTKCAKNLSKAVVHFVRASDRRLVSSLWELYKILQVEASAGPSTIPVCIVLMCDDPAWGGMLELVTREALPPGGTPAWSSARSWLAAAGVKGNADPQDGEATAVQASVDSNWHDEWNADWEKVRESGATQSHSFPVVQEAKESPPLAEFHHGPWMVLPIDPVGNPQEALKPFEWVADSLALAPEVDERLAE